MYKIHNSLNPNLWQNETLKPNIKSHLINIATQFYKTLKIDTELEDILLTGSSANFNYNESSDVDLHLLISFSKVNCDSDMIEEFFLAKKSQWNDNHNITIKGHNVEVYVQDTAEEHVSTGVYSLLEDKWIIKPKVSNFYIHDVNKQEFIKKFNNLRRMLDYSISHNSNPNFLKKIKEKLSDMRQQGLDRNGEMDVNNLVFKELRSRKYLDKLSQAIISLQDKKLSVESFMHFHYAKKKQ